MNKKANIPVTIMVIGTILVCIVALISFDRALKREDNDVSYFKYIEVMNNVKNDVEFTKLDLDAVKELYPFSLSSFSPKGSLFSRNKGTCSDYYNPVVKDIKEDKNYLIYRIEGKQFTLLEIKVKK